MVVDIRLANVSKNFGDVTAVDHLELKVNQGEVFCLVGPNAAGKTTTIRLILGILNPDMGELTVKGYQIPEEKFLNKGY